MSENPSSTPFIDSSNIDRYGKKPLQSWVGKVVGYDKQKDQIDNGWGWRYKVRILGDHSSGGSNNLTVIPDEKLSYAYVLLPTTAGSGAAFKLRSVRVSQGDMVYGVHGGGGPRMIIGVFPRTRQTSNSSETFGTLSGFYGSLNSGTKILGGEYNEQIGPKTPDVTPVDPKNYNKSNKEDTSESLDQIGYDRNQDGIIDDAEKKLTPITTAQDKKWDVGEPITSQQLKYITSSYPITRKERTEYQTEVVEAINQAVTQNLVDEEVAKSMITQVKRNNYDGALKIGFPDPTPFSEEPIVP